MTMIFESWYVLMDNYVFGYNDSHNYGRDGCFVMVTLVMIITVISITSIALMG